MGVPPTDPTSWRGAPQPEPAVIRALPRPEAIAGSLTRTRTGHTAPRTPPSPGNDSRRPWLVKRREDADWIAGPSAGALRGGTSVDGCWRAARGAEGVLPKRHHAGPALLEGCSCRPRRVQDRVGGYVLDRGGQHRHVSEEPPVELHRGDAVGVRLDRDTDAPASILKAQVEAASSAEQADYRQVDSHNGVTTCRSADSWDCPQFPKTRRYRGKRRGPTLSLLVR